MMEQKPEELKVLIPEKWKHESGDRLKPPISSTAGFKLHIT